MVATYSQFDVKLPQSVIKLQKHVLRDFSLLHPLKVMEALDPEAFDKEEIELQKQMLIELRAKEEAKKRKLTKNLTSSMKNF